MEKKNPKELNFFKDIAKYFMDFLETDFHKRRHPRRSIKYKNNDNLQVGINLEKYTTFTKEIYQLIEKSFKSESQKKISKGVHKTSLPKNLLDLIYLQIKKLDQKLLNKIQKQISECIEKAATLHKKELDKAISFLYEEQQEIILKNLTKPFIESIEKPLQNLGLGDEDHIFEITEELNDVFFNLVKNKSSELLNQIIAKNKLNINKELGEVFNLEEIQESLYSFFGELKINDLFMELFQVEKNKKILDKQDLYLYFGDITYENKKYPIFYIPIETADKGTSIALNFDSQIYINKKAINYIVQEYNQKKELKGNIESDPERIIYLSQFPENLLGRLNKTIEEIQKFFDLKGDFNLLSQETSSIRNQLIKVTNQCYLCLSDKSDEALLNDYEEILTGLGVEDGALSKVFQELLENFIHKNPESFNNEVETEWDESDTEDKLVYPSPIPLNSEQRQILKSITKKDCKYISVSGPPGTGKSHTITAIVFDAIQKDKSVLVLSDKKEALDVVEDKITQTMNKVRYGDNSFRNPILRLGKTGNTYSEILSRTSLDQIKNHHRAVKNQFKEINENIDNRIEFLKEDIDNEISSYEEIELEEINEFQKLEKEYPDGTPIIDATEFSDTGNLIEVFSDLYESVDRLEENLANNDVNNFIKYISKDLQVDHSTDKLINFIEELIKLIAMIEVDFKTQSNEFINKFEIIKENDIRVLSDFVTSYDGLKTFLIGYLFKKKDIENLNKNTKLKLSRNSVNDFDKYIDDIRKLLDIALVLENNQFHLDDSGVELISLVHKILIDEFKLETLNKIVEAKESFKVVSEFTKKYPKTTNNLSLDIKNYSNAIENNIFKQNKEELDKQLRYIYLEEKISDSFKEIPESNYVKVNHEIEELLTTKVTHQMDDRLINFFEQNKNDATTLKNIIRGKQKFPKDQFNKLKSAFPCILAGIRDYAEYIPLDTEIFDLVIIDEASQVSLAQAFPALLRAKKVLVLGDKKQFSNVKSAQARSDTNREYLNQLSKSFKENVSEDPTKIERLKKFNIKTSILDFFEYISNYSIQLMKHFRGYKEIISYSNRYFYNNTLQVMKILGKPTSEVLKFSFVNATLDDETYPNTNLAEVKFICEELVKLRKSHSTDSIGIITPHTNQQKLLIEHIANLPEWIDLQEINNIKIMTFDTCQGEERNIVFYSMVATLEKDKLWGVFIKNLNDVDLEEDGQIKAQRLNVGFSRAKETMHFVCSKPIIDYKGSIGEALKHYEHTLNESLEEKTAKDVDQSSKMEGKVLNWFYQTEFWLKNKEKVEFNPQFEIGSYLKQLDPTYTYPMYVADFLVSYRISEDKIKNIIIEYDGFQEHFGDNELINEYNYQDYYSEDDVYRQKVLESYGYSFIRINRFNVGNNPIKELNQRIENTLKETNAKSNLIKKIQSTVDGLSSGDKKECPKCKKVREANDFVDKSLESGFGRNCRFCKATKKVRKKKKQNSEQKTTSASILTNVTCPKCGSGMKLRSGKYGEFYGCSKFPYCRGTKNL